MLKQYPARFSRALLTGLFVVTCPVVVGAQEPLERDSAAADSTVEKAQALDPVRIDARRASSRYAPAFSRTALKTPALARDVPQSLVTITAGLARDLGMQGMADVVRYVPGATMGQGEGNRDQLTIRGNSSTADFFVDGMRDDVQYFRDLYNLERVEALKGPNAMVFGRGGGGGILNRVTKEADWLTRHQITAEGASSGARRVSTDLQRPISPWMAARLNSVFENSDTYRDGVILRRTGINPTFTIATPSRKTHAVVGYEYFEDDRTADRGVPSWQGRPLKAEPSTFFGDPEESFSAARVNSAVATISHDAGPVQLRNSTRLADYDKFYQNIFPGALSVDGTMASITAYSHATDRTNLINQTDVTVRARTGSVIHDVLVGAEVGKQSTDNFRMTGFFNDSAASVLVTVANPRSTDPVSFRQSASDADNGTVVATRSLYAQDHVSVSRHLRLVAGARYERFAIEFTDLRANATRSRSDHMISPRAGLIFKPDDHVSAYGSYSLSFLPGSGDQFASLTEATKALEPERFSNYEAGLKWDVLDRLALTAALYRLYRTNTRSVDPAMPTRVVQTGEQRSEGVEIGAAGHVTGGWEVVAGFTRQDAQITSATAASAAGARVPLVPHTSASIWNRFQLSPRIGFGAGVIHQSSVFAAIDNKVVLPSFTRYDGALFARVGWGLTAQVNVENVLDTRYFATAHSNNNITPGAPRSARLSITAEF